jgi:hypothetical protein
MSRPGVTTVLSDVHYARLLTQAGQMPDHVIHEELGDDTEPTRIWLTEAGTLMSKMPSEPYEKLILPYTVAMQKLSESGGELISSNRGQLTQRFVDRGMRNEVAMELSHKIYRKLPASVRVSDAAVDAMYAHHVNGGERVLTFVIDDKGEFTVRGA